LSSPDALKNEQAVILLLDALAHPELATKPVLLILNKMEVAPAQMPGTFKEMLGLKEILEQERGQGRVMECLEGSALQRGFAGEALSKAKALLLSTS